MSSIGRWSVPLVLALLLTASSAEAQFGIRVNVPITPPRGVNLPTGTSVSAVFGAGVNPFRSGPQVASNPGPRNVYNINTAGFNPYLNAAFLDSAYANANAAYGNQALSGMIGAGPGVGYGSALQGIAGYTQAEGQYWRDIQTARLYRESARQANIDSARRQLEFEMWVDRVRPTSQRMLNTVSRVELDRARRVPTAGDIESGAMLNTLFKSIQKGKLNRGPNIPLDADLLKRINLNGGTSAGNVGLLKTIDKIVWPEALREEAYEEPRKRLVENMKKAVASLKNGEMVPASLRKDLRTDYKAIADKLEENISEVQLSQHTEALRFLRQVNSAITALSDPKSVNFYNNAWAAKGRNVAELIDHMTQQGLTFAEATEGDEGAYQALYQALQSFEAGMQEG